MRLDELSKNELRRYWKIRNQSYLLGRLVDGFFHPFTGKDGVVHRFDSIVIENELLKLWRMSNLRRVT